MDVFVSNPREIFFVKMIDQLYLFLGEEKIRRLVSAFYDRVKKDDVIGPMYPQNDWEGAEKRLADFLCFRFGGPDHYLRERGHPRLRARHLPFQIGLKERNRWLDLMGEAMREAEIPEQYAPALGAFFAQVADFMRNVEE